MGPREEAVRCPWTQEEKGNMFVRNSGGKECPWGLHVARVKGLLPDTDRVTGGTQEDGEGM